MEIFLKFEFYNFQLYFFQNEHKISKNVNQKLKIEKKVKERSSIFTMNISN
jgi:hypothetical protein